VRSYAHQQQPTPNNERGWGTMSRAGKVRAKSHKARKAARKVRKAPEPKHHAPQLAMSVLEFCISYGIRRNLFYELLRAGKAPDCMQLGRRRIITLAAAERWERQREAENLVA
jgi:hypothetical protein